MNFLKQVNSIRVSWIFLFFQVSLISFSQELEGPSNVSPYHTIVTHLVYLQPENYNPDLTRICFNPTLDSVTAIKIARQLKMVLDAKGLYVAASQLPENPNYIDSVSGRSVYVLFKKELPSVYVEKKGVNWLYSKETVTKLPELVKEVYPWGTHHLVNWLPTDSTKRFLGLSSWQYLGIVLLIILCGLIYYLWYYVFHAVFNKVIKSRLKNWQVDDDLLWTIARLFSLVLVFRIAYILFPVLRFPVQSNHFILLALKITLAVFLMILAFKVTDLIISQLNRVVATTESRMDDQLLPIVNRLIKIIIGFLTVLYVLNILHVNITAIVAGVSIGGLALALAAQDTVKNLLGSLMIFVDQPFQVGDYIEVNGEAGTVEEVGFRTTRIRTADTSLIAIPNGNVANYSINNKGVRPRRFVNLSIGVTYNTPLRYLRIFREGLEELIVKHPKLADDPRYVFINSLDDSSITIIFRTYVETAMYYEELAVREQLILSILELAEVLGIQIAFPSSTIYIDQIPGQVPLNASYTNDETELINKKNFFLDKLNLDNIPT